MVKCFPPNVYILFYIVVWDHSLQLAHGKINTTVLFNWQITTIINSAVIVIHRFLYNLSV